MLFETAAQPPFYLISFAAFMKRKSRPQRRAKRRLLLRQQIFQSGQRPRRRNLVLAFDTSGFQLFSRMGTSRIGIKRKAKALRNRFAKVDALAFIKHRIAIIGFKFDLGFEPLHWFGHKANFDRLIENSRHRVAGCDALLRQCRVNSTFGQYPF